MKSTNFLFPIFFMIIVCAAVAAGQVTSTPEQTGHNLLVFGTAVSTDAGMLVSRGPGELIFWDLKKQKPLQAARDPRFGMSRVIEISSNGKVLAFGVDKNIGLQFFDTKKKSVLTGHTKDVGKVFFSPDGRFLLSIDDNLTSGNETKVWDVAAGKMLKDLTVDRQTDGYPVAAVFVPGEKRLTIVYQFQIAFIYVRHFNTETWEELPKTPNFLALGSVHQISPDGKTAVSTDYGNINVVDIVNGKILYTLPFKIDIFRTTNVRISADGKWLVLLGSDKNKHGDNPLYNTILVWDLVGKKQISLIEPSAENKAIGLDALSISNDGKMIFAGRGEKVVSFDATTGKEISQW